MSYDVNTSGETEDLRELDTTGSSASLSLMLEEELTQTGAVSRQLSDVDSGSRALGAAKKKVDGPGLVSVCRIIVVVTGKLTLKCVGRG